MQKNCKDSQNTENLKGGTADALHRKGECPIRVSISIGSTRFMTGIGYNCATEAWEDGHGVKARYTNSKGVSSKIINACISNIQVHFTQYEVNRFVHFLRVKRNLEEKTVQKQFNNLNGSSTGQSAKDIAKKNTSTNTVRSLRYWKSLSSSSPKRNCYTYI